MAKAPGHTSGEALRPLKLDPERAKRADRAPDAIVDIGSNSIRLLVYDQLGRAPMPRFNEKSLARLAEGLAESGAIGPDHFRRAVEAVRRFRAIADAMGVARIDAVATEAMRRASNGLKLAQAIEAESGLKVRILSGAEEARFSTLGVISGFFRPLGSVGDMGGGSLEVAEAIDDRVGDRWVSLPLGALPVEAMLSEGVPAAKRQIDEILRAKPAARAGEAGVLCGRRRLASAGESAHGCGRRAGQSRARLHPCRGRRAKICACCVAALRGETGGDAGRGGTPGAHIAGGGARARSPAEAPEARARRFFRAGLAGGFSLRAVEPKGAVSRSADRGRAAIGLPLARVPEFAGELASWTESLFPAKTAAEKRLRVAVCALSDIAWRDAADLRAEESFRRLIEFPFIGVTHPERVYSRRRHSRPLCRPAGRALAESGDQAAHAEGTSPGADSRPRHPARLPLFRRRPGYAGKRAIAHRSRSRSARSRRGGPRARQRSGDRPAEAARQRHRGEAERGRRHRRAIASPRRLAQSN